MLTGGEFHLAVEPYSDMVFRLACSDTRSRTNAEGVKQETLLKLYTAKKASETRTISGTGGPGGGERVQTSAADADCHCNGCGPGCHCRSSEPGH